MEKFRIDIVKDGPYKVSAGVPLSKEVILVKADKPDESIRWHKTKVYETSEEDYYLCRCGQSKNKPYCDGTHTDINFDGTEKASKEPWLDQVQVDEGESVDLLDHKEVCAGLRFCRPDGGIRDLVHKSSDPELRDLAEEQVFACTAARINLRDKETGEVVERDFDPEIATAEDPYRNYYGPLTVRGPIELYGEDGEKYEDKNRYTLCRCGESSNKPYCDSAHYECKHMELD